MNDNLRKLNLRFERSKLLRTKLNKKIMKLNEEVTKMGGETYITSSIVRQHVVSDTKTDLRNRRDRIVVCLTMVLSHWFRSPPTSRNWSKVLSSSSSRCKAPRRHHRGHPGRRSFRY